MPGRKIQTSDSELSFISGIRDLVHNIVLSAGIPVFRIEAASHVVTPANGTPVLKIISLPDHHSERVIAALRQYFSITDANEPSDQEEKKGKPGAMSFYMAAISDNGRLPSSIIPYTGKEFTVVVATLFQELLQFDTDAPDNATESLAADISRLQGEFERVCRDILRIRQRIEGGPGAAATQPLTGLRATPIEDNPEEGIIITNNRSETTGAELKSSSAVPLSDTVLLEFVRSSELIRETDQMIAARANARIGPQPDIDGDLERLHFLKIETLEQLQDELMNYKNEVVDFAEKWIGNDSGGTFDSGISLFYLEYLLVARKNDLSFAIDYVLKYISDTDYSARFIIPTYQAVLEKSAPQRRPLATGA